MEPAHYRTLSRHTPDWSSRIMNPQAPVLLLLSASLFGACGLSCRQTPSEPVKTQGQQESRKDPHSYSNPEHIKVRHLDLDLEVSFEKKALEGSATLTVERVTGSGGAAL